MRTIWKYQFTANDVNQISMPRDAKILDVQVQGGQPMVWAMVDSDNEPEIRRFLITGTGQRIHDHDGEYLGTFQVNAGMHVFHVFELK